MAGTGGARHGEAKRFCEVEGNPEPESSHRGPWAVGNAQYERVNEQVIVDQPREHGK